MSSSGIGGPAGPQAGNGCSDFATTSKRSGHVRRGEAIGTRCIELDGEAAGLIGLDRGDLKGGAARRWRGLLSASGDDRQHHNHSADEPDTSQLHW
jgi:hypothetical protein